MKKSITLIISIALFCFVSSISSASSTRTLTVDTFKSSDLLKTWTPPAATDTIVGRLSTDTLTNKSISGSTNTLTSIPLTSAVTGTLPVGNGGTGVSNPTSGSVLVGNGSSAVSLVAPGTSGNVLTSNGSTWTSAAASGGGTITSWASDGNITFGGAGTTSGISVYSRRVGDCLELRGHFTTGTVDGNPATLIIGGSRTIDTAKMSSDVNLQAVGYWNLLASASTNLNTESASGQVPLFYDGSSTTKLNFTRAAVSNAYISQAGNGIWSSSAPVSFFTTCIPITGW